MMTQQTVHYSMDAPTRMLALVKAAEEVERTHLADIEDRDNVLSPDGVHATTWNAYKKGRQLMLRIFRQDIQKMAEDSVVQYMRDGDAQKMEHACSFVCASITYMSEEVVWSRDHLQTYQ